MTPAHRAALLARLRELEPTGKTPLGLSLEESVRDLSRSGAGAPTKVVLLSDGGDDTRSGHDPLEAAARLGSRKNVDVVVIGFSLTDDAAREQLAGIARAAGGVFVPAGDTASLTQVLRGAFGEIDASFTVRTEAGDAVAEGTLGAVVELPPGDYRLEMRPFGRPRVTAFRVPPGGTVSIVCNAGAARLTEATGAREPGEASAPAEPKSQRLRFCTSCGERLLAGARFCVSCGARIPE